MSVCLSVCRFQNKKTSQLGRLHSRIGSFSGFEICSVTAQINFPNYPPFKLFPRFRPRYCPRFDLRHLLEDLEQISQSQEPLKVSSGCNHSHSTRNSQQHIPTNDQIPPCVQRAPVVQGGKRGEEGKKGEEGGRGGVRRNLMIQEITHH